MYYESLDHIPPVITEGIRWSYGGAYGIICKETSKEAMFQGFSITTSL